jgi:hemolysin III
MNRQKRLDFPIYTTGERKADAIVHGLGIAAGGAGAVWMVIMAAKRTSGVEFLSLAVYCLGLAGMLGASALYHLTPPGRGKEMLRRIDHAMIFIMIAGSYTPYAVNRLGEGGQGMILCAAVWGVALAGVVLKLAFPRRFERAGFFLYLALGWAIAVVARPLSLSVSDTTLLLLVIGGVIYTVGALIHLLEHLPYHNPVWHALVLVAAACHYKALTLEFLS